MIPIRDTVPRRSPPVVTWLLILANAVVFLFELVLPEQALLRFFFHFGIVPARFTNPEWGYWVGLPTDYWPFLTSMFLHAGWMHVIGNMWALWIFGDNVEDRMGGTRFLIFYLLCGLAAGAAHCLVNADSTVPTVGASGAIAGVMGAYLVLFPNARVIVLLPVFLIPYFFHVPAVTYMGFWILSQVFSGTLALASGQDVGGVAWWAHIGGFIAGILFVWLFRQRDYRRPSRDEYWIEGAWLPRTYWRRLE